MEIFIVKYPRQMSFFDLYQRTVDPDTPTQRPPGRHPTFYIKNVSILFNRKLIQVIISYVNSQLKKVIKEREKNICLADMYVL